MPFSLQQSAALGSASASPRLATFRPRAAPVRLGTWATLLLTFATAVPVLGQGQNSPGTPTLLTLQQAIVMATEDNPEGQLAAAREQEAKAEVQSVRSALFPKVGASETFTDSTDPVFAFGARLRQGRFTANDFSPTSLNHPAATIDFESSATASWMLFDSGKSVHQLRAARSSLRASGLQAEATRQGLAYQAIRDYYRALLADQEKQTTAAAVARARSFDQEAHDRVQAGLALAAEGMQSEVELSQRQLEAAEAESNATLAYADLAGVLGEPSKSFSLVVPAGAPTPVSATLDDLQANALRARPDLAAARISIASSAEELRASRSAFGPSVSTFARVEADNPRITGGGNGNWTVGAKAEVQLFDGGARKADLLKASAQRELAQIRYRQVEAQALLEVKRSFFAVQTAQRQYGISDEMIARVSETLRTTLDRYDAGLVTITDVLTQQQQLRSVELSRVESLYRWWTAEAQLRLAAGEDILMQAGTHP